MGIESYYSPPGLQPECWTLPGLQWESGSPPDSGGNTRGRVKYRWTPGIQDELRSLKEMGVYKLIPHSDIPTGCKVLHGKWVLLLKHDENGTPIWHKACFIVKGFEQVFGQDYSDTTSPTALMESVHLLLNITTAKDWDIQQINIKTVFLYSLLPADEAQYLEQPESFVEPGKVFTVWFVWYEAEQPYLEQDYAQGHVRLGICQTTC